MASKTKNSRIKLAHVYAPVVSQSTVAYFALENMIVMGELKPATWLSELSLSQGMGIGRTPVREALKELERDNLVEIVPSRGVRVKELHTYEQLQMLEVRRPLEKMVDRRAAELGNDAQRKQLLALSEQTMGFVEEENQTQAMLSNRECCRMIWTMCGNASLVRAITPLFSSTRRFVIFYGQFPQHAEIARLHHAQAIAVSQGVRRDVDRASDNMMDYLESFARSILSTQINDLRDPFSLGKSENRVL